MAYQQFTSFPVGRKAVIVVSSLVSASYSSKDICWWKDYPVVGGSLHNCFHFFPAVLDINKGKYVRVSTALRKLVTDLLSSGITAREMGIT